jgi:hypothetical protein
MLLFPRNWWTDHICISLVYSKTSAKLTWSLHLQMVSPLWDLLCCNRVEWCAYSLSPLYTQICVKVTYFLDINIIQGSYKELVISVQVDMVQVTTLWIWLYVYRRIHAVVKFVFPHQMHHKANVMGTRLNTLVYVL